MDLLASILRARVARRALLKTVPIRRMDEATLEAYFGSLMRDAGVRWDLARFLGGVSNRSSLEAARRFPGFRRPVLIAWGEEDLFFPVRLAGRLQRDFPAARLELVDRSRAFVPEDRPERLAGLIAGFARERTGTGVGGDVA